MADFSFPIQLSAESRAVDLEVVGAGGLTPSIHRAAFTGHRLSSLLWKSVLKLACSQGFWSRYSIHRNDSSAEKERDDTSDDISLTVESKRRTRQCSCGGPFKDKATPRVPGPKDFQHAIFEGDQLCKEFSFDIDFGKWISS